MRMARQALRSRQRIIASVRGTRARRSSKSAPGAIQLFAPGSLRRPRLGSALIRHAKFARPMPKIVARARSAPEEARKRSRRRQGPELSAPSRFSGRQSCPFAMPCALPCAIRALPIRVWLVCALPIRVWCAPSPSCTLRPVLCPRPGSGADGIVSLFQLVGVWSGVGFLRSSCGVLAGLSRS